MAIGKGDKANFETLRAAMRSGDLALMECTERSTGQSRAVVCAVIHRPDKSFDFVPLAVMVWDNPYELFAPPTTNPGEPQ